VYKARSVWPAIVYVCLALTFTFTAVKANTDDTAFVVSWHDYETKHTFTATKPRVFKGAQAMHSKAFAKYN